MKQFVHIEDHALRELPRILDALSATSIAVFCGRRSYQASGAADIVRSIQGNYRIEIIPVDAPLPLIEDMRAYAAHLIAFKPQVLVAIGGGHVIDTAKLVNVLVANSWDVEKDDIAAFTPAVEGVPLIAVPTTAGSGSEATHFAVVYSGVRKFSIAAPFMLPRIALIDPTLLMSASPSLRSISGADTLCQAVESLWSTGATADSIEFARQALFLSLTHLEGWVESPTPDRASGMAKASFLAGKAINITKTTAPHALSYYLTSHYEIPHGQAVALFLPAFLEFNLNATPATLSDTVSFSDFSMQRSFLLQLLAAEDGRAAALRVARLLERIRIHTNLRSLGITDGDASVQIADSINLERLRNNPRRPSRDELIGIIRSLS